MGRKTDYTDRPLTEEERIFASDSKNYKELFTFMLPKHKVPKPTIIIR